MTNPATFTTPEADDDDTGEDLGDLDDLLESVRSEEEPAPKRGRKPKGNGNGVTPEPTSLSKIQQREGGRKAVPRATTP